MNVHAKPVEFPVLTQLVRGEAVNPTPEVHLEAPPSIYQEIEGKSYLSKFVNTPVTLRGTAQELVLSWPVAPATTPSVAIDVEWTEE